MDIQQWLDRLASELRRGGLPPAYIARYVAELQDHINDLIEERRAEMSKDALTEAQILARIGDSTTLADFASIEFARRSFWGRHPIVTFLLAPIPLAVLAWATTFAALFASAAGIAMLCEWMGADSLGRDVTDWPAAALMAIPAVFLLGVIAPPAALTMLLCRLARRNGLSWRWSLAGCLMVALIAGMFQAVLEPATTPDGNGRAVFGFGWWLVPPTQQWLQFALPLTIGLGLLWRQSHRNTGCPQAPPDASVVNCQAA